MWDPMRGSGRAQFKVCGLASFMLLPELDTEREAGAQRGYRTLRTDQYLVNLMTDFKFSAQVTVDCSLPHP